MKTLIVVVSEADRDIVLAEFCGYGTLGVVEEGNELRAFFDNQTDLAPLLRQWPNLQPTIEDTPDVDWTQVAKEMWEPFPVGQSLYLVPEWRSDQPPPGRIRLTTYPGMACGTGLHPATRLALEMLESAINKGDRVLDVGTGSGILADAAHRLGAGAVVGCDIDLDSALIARRNLPDAVAVFAGSVRSIRPASFDLVVANLNAATLTALGRTLVECGRPGGKCILSGVRKEEIALLEGIAGAKATSTLMLEGWVSLEL